MLPAVRQERRTGEGERSPPGPAKMAAEPSQEEGQVEGAQGARPAPPLPKGRAALTRPPAPTPPPPTTPQRDDRHAKAAGDHEAATARMPTFTVIEAGFVVFSMGTYVADQCTDVFLSVDYFVKGQCWWAGLTLVLVLLPTALVHAFSLRWHQFDLSHPGPSGLWVIHTLLLGVLHRYVSMLWSGLEFRKSGDLLDFQRFAQQQSDVAMLRLFESFLESAPQLLLQLYIMIVRQEWQPWTSVSAVASLVSLSWGIAAYTRALRTATPEKQRLSMPGLFLQTVWRLGMVASRLTALLIFAALFKGWIFVFLAVHWAAMTVWVVRQKTDFCPSVWEERAYDCVVGVVYCFSFFNLKEGRSFCRACAFYVVTLTQNIAIWIMYVLSRKGWSAEVEQIYSLESRNVTSNGIRSVYHLLKGAKSEHQPILADFGGFLVIGGAILGLCCMLLYYRFFHPSGPIGAKCWWDKERGGSEEGEECGSGLSHGQSQVAIVQDLNTTPLPSLTGSSVVRKPSSASLRSFKYVCPQAESRKGSPQRSDCGSGVSILPDSPCDGTISGQTSPTKFDSSEEEPKLEPVTISNFLSALEAREEELGREIVGLKLQLIDDASVEDDVSTTEALSTHDYENICAVNIHRLGGIRSWDTYSDIQDGAHDGSVYREVGMRRAGEEGTVTSTSSRASEAGDTSSSDYAEVGAVNPAVLFPQVFGHILDPIQEETEGSVCTTSTSSSKFHWAPFKCAARPLPAMSSSSTLVATIEEIQNGSLSNLYDPMDPTDDVQHILSRTQSCPSLFATINEDEDDEYEEKEEGSEGNLPQLTYSEVSFLARLNELGPETKAESRKKPRRKFSLIRERFEKTQPSIEGGDGRIKNDYCRRSSLSPASRIFAYA